MRVVLLSVALLVSTPALALPPETWLVAVGNNHGDRDDIGLLYAERDAQQFVEALQSQGGVPPRYTTVLLDREASEIRDTLVEINARIRERSATVPTALVVFYSGHADADALHLDGSRLPMNELKKLVQGSSAAFRLLVVDACRSGAMTRVKGVRPVESFQMSLAQESDSEGMAIVTSSAASEASRESDLLHGSFFTHHLINALRGAGDENNDGVVTLTEAYSYAYTQTLRASGRTLELQHPTYSYDVKGKGEVVLSRPRDAVGRTGHLMLGGEYVYLISEGREGGPIMAEVAAVHPSTLLSLPAGSYFIQERRPTESREYQVNIAPGSEVTLASTTFRSVRYDRLVRARGGEKLYTQGLLLLAGGHGAMLAGDGPSPQLIVGYNIDLQWLSLSARVRGATVSSSGVENVLPRQHREYGFGVAAQRFVDLKSFSVSFGILLEGALHQQTFSGPRPAPDRSVFGGNFAGIASVERALTGGLAIHLEGGPVTGLFTQATVANDGRQTGKSFSSPFTWWAAGGLIWRY
jgi:hypothetical protein